MSETETKQSTDGSSNGTLAAALLAAQHEMPAVEPDATNPHFRSKFVSLGNLIAKVRPVLNRHGLAFAQFPSADQGGQPTLVTILVHESGERMEYAAPLLLPKNDPQGQGSAITYMRRYALAAALGISDQEDDDGNSAGTGKTAGGNGAKAKAAEPEPNPELEELVQRSIEGFKTLALPYSEINLLLGSVGADAPKLNRADSILKALRALNADQMGELWDRLDSMALAAVEDGS